MNLSPRPLSTKSKRGIAISLLVIFIIILLKTQSFNQSTADSNTAILQGSKNKFNLTFNLEGTNKDNFSKVLEKLTLPQSVKEGIEFKLDATSSAKLSFLTPASAKLDIQPDKIRAEGSLTRQPYQLQFKPSNIQFPQSSNLIIIAPNLVNFLKTQIALPQEIADWFTNQSSSQKEQYLAIYGQDADFALITYNNGLNFELLKTLNLPDQKELVYKEETINDTNFHLLKIPDQAQDKNVTLALFQVDDWVFLTSSLASAQEILKVQKSQSPSQDFKILNSNRSVFLVLRFINTQENPAPDKLYELPFLKDKEIAKIVKKIETLDFTLKQKGFSGLIELK